MKAMTPVRRSNSKDAGDDGTSRQVVANRTLNDQLVYLAAPTVLGEFVAGYSARGLARLDFPSKSKPQAVSLITDAPAEARGWHQTTVRALKNVLTGKDGGKLPPLDWSAGTDFQCSVWSVMLTIRVGQTLSYGEIARAIGKPKAVRAVGGACGANRIPVLVPCHRVLAANGKIGGFSGGLDWKRTLLEREGVKQIR